MNESYNIHEDTIIFNCDFNDSLDKYNDIIKNYKKIIFSNYNDYKICIETNNKFIDKYFKYFNY